MKKIDMMLEGLEARLSNAAQAKVQDEDGNSVFIDEKVIKPKVLKTFLRSSLSSLNLMLGCNLSFGDSNRATISKYESLIVQGALLSALSSQALLERGREFTLSDNGVDFKPPRVSDILMRQWEIEQADYIKKLEMLRS